MKAHRTLRSVRTIAAVAVFAAATFLGATFVGAQQANAATTQFGQCDFGAPAIAGFTCNDSDDLKVQAGAALTDNGPFSDELDIDWYANQANAKLAKIRGDLRLLLGYTGTATMRIQCVNSDGSIDTTRSVTIATTFGLLPQSKDASFICAGNNLSKVRVSIHYVDALGRVSDDSGAREYGD